MVNGCLLRNNGSGSAPIVMFNTSLCTQVLKEGTYLEKAAKVNLIQTRVDEPDDSCCGRTDDLCEMNVWILSTECIQWRKQELQKQISSSYNPQLWSNHGRRKRRDKSCGV